MARRLRHILTPRQHESWRGACLTRVYSTGKILSSFRFKEAILMNLRTSLHLAVPDLLLTTLFTTLDSGAAWDLLRIARGSLLNIAALILCNFRKRSACEN